MRTFALRHVRLLLSALTGVVVFLAAPVRDTVVSVLIGWNSFAVLFLTLVLGWMLRQSPEQFRSTHEQEDEAAPFVLLVATIAALLSLVAIVALLASPKVIPASERAFRSGLAGLTVVSSWVLAAIMFTLHYANLFYTAKPNGRPLKFPETPLPVFADFAYFSFTIAATCQTSDVSTHDASIRRIVLTQGLVFFVFNLLVLGFAVNVTSGMLNGR